MTEFVVVDSLVVSPIRRRSQYDALRCIRHGERHGEDERRGTRSRRPARNGDLVLLAIALDFIQKDDIDEVVVITNDKPLRKTCKELGIPLSGSIGVVIAAVERGDLDPAEAKDALVAMDEVGARLSARLLRRAERMIDDAADETD